VKAAGIAFVAATATGLVLTPVIRNLAHRWGLLDHALTTRKIHEKPIPRLGGVAIVIAFFVPLLGLLFVNSEIGTRFYSDPLKAFGLIAGGLGIALVGIIDDIRGMRARHKLLGQLVVAGIVYACGYRIDVIANPFGSAISLGVLALPFTLLWITGIINALNLIDGLDGLAGGIAFVAVATTFAIAAFNGEPLMLLFTAALAGATLGFLVYNFNPASIFMGDTGSMFLGFILATTAIASNLKASATAVSLLVPIVALGIPIGDTLLSMGRRWLRGVPMFQADRGHIHHRLLDCGFTQRQAVLVIYAFSAFLSLCAIALVFVSASAAALLLAGLGGVLYVLLRRLGYFHLGDAQRVLAARRRNLQLRAALRPIREHLAAARTHWEVWTALQFAAAPFGASAVALRLPTEAQNEGAVNAEADPFEIGFENPSRRMFRARYGLAVERPGHPQIELGWTDGRKAIDRDTEIAIELLCEHLADAIERIERPEDEREISNIIRLMAWRRTG
jgi:UDP-GlcNAc:undecaprenyl-phosphate/decaprenyl-phosphate GlcNAc-1-phosphate transferase